MFGLLKFKSFPFLLVAGLIVGLGISFSFLATYQRGYKSGYSKGSLTIQQQWDHEKAQINQATANAIAEAVKKAQEQAMLEKQELIRKNQESARVSQEIIMQANREAQAWKRQFQEALKEPMCQQWSEVIIPCPIN